MDQEEKARLIRVDERTKYMSEQLDEALNEIEKNREDIDEVEAMARRNQTKIKGAMGAFTAVSTGVLALLGKIAGILRF